MMTKGAWRLAPLCLLACGLWLGGSALTPAAAAQCPAGQFDLAGGCRTEAAIQSDIAGIVETQIAKNDLNSAIVKVSVDGREVLRRAWGRSMTGVPATADMHFRNGAIAISYMTTLLLALQDRGLLSVDDRLSKWFPDYPEADEVTLAMLARSTSGYADYVNLDILPIYDDVFRQWQADELIALGLKQDMKCAPGTCFAYAHTNYVILGKVLSKAAGMDLAALLRRDVLEPLALRHTVSDQTATMPEPVQHAFTSERGIYEDSTYWNPSWTLAEGAVMTTDIDDALASIEAIGSGQLLSQPSFAQQLAPVTARFPPFSAKIHYGMGVIVSNGWIVQTPSFAGYAVAVGYEPQKKIAIAVSVTAGEKTPEASVANVIFGELGAYFRPDHAPEMVRRRSGD